MAGLPPPLAGMVEDGPACLGGVTAVPEGAAHQVPQAGLLAHPREADAADELAVPERLDREGVLSRPLVILDPLARGGLRAGLPQPLRHAHRLGVLAQQVGQRSRIPQRQRT